jgi:hypothetical protein
MSTGRHQYLISRIILVSISVAAKFVDDKFFGNDFYSKVGGISLSEFNLLEVHFMIMLSFDLMIQPQNYQNYLSQLGIHVYKVCPHLLH